MSDNITSKELIERLVKLSGIKKKLASEILHVIPEIIEEGLKRDGEVRVKGLGIFRLKYVMGRIGRNPKTGERVAIPAHNRLVFLPEQSFKEYINRDNRLLGYKVIPLAGESAVSSQQSAAERSEVSTLSGSEVSIQNPEPGTWNPEPGTRNLEPGTWNPEPGTRNLEPGTLNSEFPPIRRRRIHWIVPLAALVIIALSLVFYFRNFYPGSQKTEVSSQQSAVGGQESAVGGQQSAVSSQQSAVSSQESAVGGQESAVGGQESAAGRSEVTTFSGSEDRIQNSEPGTWNSEPGTQNPELKTQNSGNIIISEGKHLFQLSREVYGNPYLWVLIYKANQDIISDPDQAIAGKEVKIPALEGSPDKLSRNDSLEVSEGYRLVYEFYQSQGDTRAGDFQKNSLRYKPQ